MSAESRAALGSAIGFPHVSGKHLPPHEAIRARFGQGATRVSDAALLADTNDRSFRKAAIHPNVLPWSYFLWQLSREQRRADRTKASLSLVMLDRATLDSGNEYGSDAFLELIRNCTRDTDVVSQCDADRVAVLLPETDAAGASRLIEKITSKMGSNAVKSHLATYPDKLFEFVLSQKEETGDTTTYFVGDSPRRADYLGKRVLDVIGSSLALIVLLPLMLVVAAAVKLSSPGPVLFKQPRLGRKGTPFMLYKFRSMRCNSDDSAHRAFVSKLIKGDHQSLNQPASNSVQFKIQADPRVTRVGALLRRMSIDELPQFFNVLRGDMSLVGPRPPIKYEAESYQSWHLRRVLEAKPGITGIWQVYGRSKVSFDEMVRMDLNYIKRASLKLDVKLLFATIGVVLRRDGAV